MRFLSLVVLLLGWAFTLSTAHAHLIVSQRGTLNIVGDGVFMVLSLPVSAFKGIDDNADGLLSVDELRAHAATIETQIKRSVILENGDGVKRLDGLMLNTVPPESDHTGPAKQIVLLGRFDLGSNDSNLRFSMRLFGSGSDERIEHVIVTRGSESQLMTLSPERAMREVLPPVWSAFLEQIRQGGEHVLSGTDHLLFLLVVLAAGLSLREAALALSCFTVGHAITLIACTWFGLFVSPNIVEPAIAATVIGMASFDRWSHRYAFRHLTSIRLILIFLCALIHGLGLAGALTDLGLDPMHKAICLAGFNIGIEFAQLAVAILAAAVMLSVKAMRGTVGLTLMIRMLSYTATCLGTFWLVERIAFAT
jgi:HupE / UreJ protein